ncbi:MAG: hypothetical protein K5669_01310 [Lachnospiraceae bacterium]|nr:hypothetical protein [Lachnospiraceae bacterium]
MSDSLEYFKDLSRKKIVTALMVLDRKLPKASEHCVKFRTVHRARISYLEWGDAIYLSGIECLSQIWVSEALIEYVKKEAEGCNVFIICPYFGMENVNDSRIKKRIKRILKQADGVIFLTKKKNKLSFFLCNEWMIKNSIELIPIYTGRAEDDVKVIELARRNNRGYTG